MMNRIRDFIKTQIQATQHHPFLFIGSGFSHRYTQSERWDELLQYFCSQFTDDPLKYAYYARKSDTQEYYGQQPQIAEFLERDFNEAVFKDEKFNTFRETYMVSLQKGSSPLKIAIADHLKEYKVTDDTNPEIDLLKKLSVRSVSGIITTNYDTLLESFFPQFEVYIGQEELIFANVAGIGEIYKIHGSIDKPDSMVLTSSDYQKFEELSDCLIAKILTIFIEYPIIFLGYSINDRNVQNILQTISRCLPQEKLNILKERFIFVNYADGDEISERSFQFNNGNISMMQISTKDFCSIYQGIYDIKSTYNPSVLRTLRKDIYNMVVENNPNGTVVATGFENMEKIEKGMNYVLGIGVSQNGHLITAEMLYEDIVYDNQYLNPELVVEEYLPELLKRNSGGLPMYKYLRDYPREVYENVKKQMVEHDSVDSFLNDGLRKTKANYRLLFSTLSVQAIIDKEGPTEAYKRLVFLENNEYDLPDLQKYLSEKLGSFPKNVLKGNSELKRLIRIYDFLKYNNHPLSNQSIVQNT